MAKSSNATAVIISLILLLSLLLIFSVAESRFLDDGFDKPESGILCDAVYGVKSGDTCSGVINKFILKTETFNIINPNLNCSALFVGQWLCIDGALNG